jgi:hypothetical protein
MRKRREPSTVMRRRPAGSASQSTMRASVPISAVAGGVVPCAMITSCPLVMRTMPKPESVFMQWLTRSR